MASASRASQPRVVITETLRDEAAHWLAQRCEVVWHKHDEDGFDDAIADAQGLVVRTYTQVNEELLDKAPNLKVVGRAGVGLDNIDVEACRARGIEVVYTPDANTQAVVEYVLGLMLDHVRPRSPLPVSVSGSKFHELRQSEVGRQLDRLTLGILGHGRIGRRVGAVAHVLGMNVHVCDLLSEAQLRKASEYPFEFVDHDKLYRESDILTIHVDGRPGNRQMIGASVLDRLKEGVLLINAARGMLVDANALAQWARDHPDSAAVLDVHDPEPPPAEYSLYGLPNVRLLPHLASRTDTAMANMSWVVRDVAAVLEGETPKAPAPA
ncbi:MAG: NAD(P)-dependent oxidoreductase [Phycisphaeraceae bacterium]